MHTGLTSEVAINTCTVRPNALVHSAVTCIQMCVYVSVDDAACNRAFALLADDCDKAHGSAADIVHLHVMHLHVM